MFKQRVQGFVIGAAAVAAIMVGLPLMSAPSPTPSLDEFAASIGVEIAWAPVTPCTFAKPQSLGCYLPATPDVIYVVPSSSKNNKQVVLHELAHVMQHRLGLWLNECDADRLANTLGAHSGEYCV